MNGLDIRAERKWMESHPGQVLDEAILSMRTRPFIITGLPRSRTAWMSVLFTTDDSFCPHELTPELPSLEVLREFFNISEYRYIGISDSALIWMLPWVLEELKAPTLIIRRELDEVRSSLSMIGLHSNKLLENTAAQLERFVNHPLVRCIDFESLNDPQMMRQAWEHVLPGKRFDVLRFEALKRLHIETDLRQTWERIRNCTMNVQTLFPEMLRCA
jgi:hypothetical protein